VDETRSDAFRSLMPEMFAGAGHATQHFRGTDGGEQ
jgi:hypothetical protein